jgi:hypothetical protein
VNSNISTNLHRHVEVRKLKLDRKFNRMLQYNTKNIDAVVCGDQSCLEFKHSCLPRFLIALKKAKLCRRNLTQLSLVGESALAINGRLILQTEHRTVNAQIYWLL